MNTIYLDPNGNAWDLTLDAGRNIAVAAPPYALAQDAASAIRTFQGEVWFDTLLGIPYWEQVLGHNPPLELMKQLFIAAALTVPNVVDAVVYITSVQGRTVSGQVQITDTAGTLSIASF